MINLLAEVRAIGERYGLSAGFVARSPQDIETFGDFAKLKYPSLPKRLLGSVSDIENLLAMARKRDFPLTFTQGETRSIVVPTADGYVAGFFVDSSDSTAQHFQFAERVADELRRLPGAPSECPRS